MKQDPEISKVKDWLNYLKTDPYQGYMLEIKIILFNWLSLKEGPAFMKSEDKTFLKTITDITHILEIKLKQELVKR